MPSISTRNFALELGPALVSGQAALVGAGTLSSTAVAKKNAAAALTGAGVLSAAAVPKRLGQAALAGTGTLSASGVPKRRGAAALTGTGALTAAATMPPIRTLVEGFDGPTIDSTRWPSVSNALIEGGRLKLPSTAPGSSIGGDRFAGPFYRLRDSKIHLRVQPHSGSQFSFQLIVAGGSQRLAWLRYLDGFFYVQQSDADGVPTDYQQTEWTVGAMEWWRVRETGDATSRAVFVETSADGSTWDYQLAYATPPGADAVWIAIGAEAWSSEGDSYVDNINQTEGAAALSGAGTLSASATVVHPKFSTLSDDFATAIDPVKWPFRSRESWEAGRAKLPLQTGGSYIGQNSASGPFYDLTGSSIFAKLEIPATPASNRSMAWLVTRVGGFSTGARFTRDRFGSLVPNQIVSNATTDSLSLPYDPVAHAWLRIREAGGTLYWDASPDGLAWTNLLSAPLRFDATQMVTAFNPISSNEAAPTSWVYVDNVNVAPPVSAAAALSGAGTLLASALRTVRGTAALVGTGTASATATHKAVAAAVLSGLGALNATVRTGLAPVVRSVGTASGAAASNTLTITLTGPVAVGETVLVRVSQAQTTGGPTMSDSKGNAYTRERSSLHTNASGTNILRNSTFRAYVTHALAAGDTLTVTYSQPVANRAGAADAVGGLLNAVDAQNGYTAAGLGIDGLGTVAGTLFAPTVANATLLYAAVYVIGTGYQSELSPAFVPLVPVADPSLETAWGGWTTVYAAGTYSFQLKLPLDTRFQLHLFSFALESVPAESKGWTDFLGRTPPRVLLRMDEAAGSVLDAKGNVSPGVVHGSVARRQSGAPVTDIPSGALKFDGSIGNYIEIPDDGDLSATTTGELTVAAWLRPDSLNPANVEGQDPPSGEGLYLHWMGKGDNDVTNRYEWMSRFYSHDVGGNPANGANLRPNRISGYHFNPPGGLGSGSFFEEVVTPGGWIFYVLQFGATGPRIFKNGVLKDADFFSDYSIVPTRTNAPFRIGTATLDSWFNGAIGPVLFYDRRLTTEEVYRLWLAASQSTPGVALSGQGTLVASAIVTAEVVSASASLSGSGALHASAVRTVRGAATLIGAGAASATAVRTARASAALQGAGALAATALRQSHASAALVGTGALTAAARRTAVASASLLGAGALQASALRSTQAAAALGGLGSLSATGTRGQHVAALLEGRGLINVISATIAAEARANLVATGNLSARSTGLATLHGSASLSGLGAMQTTATRKTDASVLLLGAGLLSASARRLLAGTAALAGAGTSVATGKKTANGKAVLVGYGTLAASAVRTVRGSPRLTGLGSALATATRSTSALAGLLGQGSLYGRGALVREAASSLSGFGELTAIPGVRVVSGTATLEGFGILYALATAMNIMPGALVIEDGRLGYVEEDDGGGLRREQGSTGYLSRV